MSAYAKLGTEHIRATLRIPAILHDRAIRRAELDGISLNHLYGAALVAWLNHLDGIPTVREITVPSVSPTADVVHIHPSRCPHPVEARSRGICFACGERVG